MNDAFARKQTAALLFTAQRKEKAFIDELTLSDYTQARHTRREDGTSRGQPSSDE
jgi:hypothetical protein